MKRIQFRLTAYTDPAGKWNEDAPNKGNEDNMFVVVAARKGTVSYKNAIEYLPEELTTHFSGTNLMIIFPDQHGNAMDEMTFAQPQHTEDRSAYESIGKWINRMKKSGKNRADGNDAQ